MKGLEGPPFKITGDEPTPIVRDFSAFLDAVEKPSVYLTKAKQTLNRATLRALNESMLTHRTETHAKTDQEFYPLLNLFQRICVSARFHVVERVKGKLRMVPTERLAGFTKLTPAERYVALLEALWVECDWGELLPRTVTWMASAAAETVMGMLQGLPAGAPVDPAAVARESIRLEVRQHGLVLLLSFFGLVDCVAEPVPYKPGSFQLRGEVRVRRLTVTAFGSHFLRVLYDERPIGSWNAYEDMRFGAETALFLDAVRESEEEGGATEPPADGEGEGTGEPPTFFEAFVPLIQGGLKSGLPHVEREAREGTFVFRVGLGPDLWRTVALSGKHSLEDLHLVIQEAFDFDNDHLYSFFMDGKLWSSRAFRDPRGEEPPFADDAMLGELDLFAGQRLLYLFDYGDEWRFDVGLLEIRSEPHGGPPKVLEKKGENPEQYPAYDEDGWEEE